MVVADYQHVCSAREWDYAGVNWVLPVFMVKCPGLELIWADVGHAGGLVDWVAAYFHE